MAQPRNVVTTQHQTQSW